MGKRDINTAMGTVLIEFDREGVSKLTLPASTVVSRVSGAEMEDNQQMDENIRVVSRMLERYFLGEEVDFGPVEISIDSQSSFYR
ncbi:MAG: hypothetical protein IME96_05080, partial [Proteobacteria bacterium]|nr:hypothetical protein [Pseudomonadota bacterium]